MTIQRLFIIIAILPYVKPIWPPSYKVNLTHEETFVISEIIGSDDTEDIYQAENEMIQEQELKKFNLDKDDGKYLQLHQLSARRNQEKLESNHIYKGKYKQKLKEMPYEEEVQPWEGGMVDKSGNIKSDSKVIYYPKEYEKRQSELKKNKSSEKAKTVSSNNDTDKDYDYNALKAEYDFNLQSFRKNKLFLNYNETKDEETVKEAVEVIFKGETTSKNCTEADRKGIGLKAAKCIWNDLTKKGLNKKERKTIFRRITTIIFIWLLVYLLVAIPCWCQRGWCCCCFQCKFCKPRERIDVAKKYLLDNPIGVYHTPEYEKVTYTPTNYEKYAQKRLEKALMKL
ncbi:hypothetical protein ILUMI_24474 [Ignelater luminosus]|uniref:Uncharacterized protein n=1 Tax=Ignelater luminosus TaxID=2038154 RepID=A0A8K0CCG5_IGNLU|nr:hypothetical protein ILUMI_24474 [Ignelater luminosus]